MRSIGDMLHEPLPIKDEEYKCWIDRLRFSVGATASTERGAAIRSSMIEQCFKEVHDIEKEYLKGETK